MTIVEMLPVEKWIELEMGINKRSNLNASVFDANGIRITNYKKWANRLCPVVKADEKGQSYICAVAHQNAANQAQKKPEPLQLWNVMRGLSKLLFLYSKMMNSWVWPGVVDYC